jgi:hypothetical protein
MNGVGSCCLGLNILLTQPGTDHVANGKADAGARLVAAVKATNVAKI